MRTLMIMLVAGTIGATAAMPQMARADTSSGEYQVAAACGYYAFAGAFQSYRSAERRAGRLGARVLDIDNSDSPNAGTGLYVVGSGPMGERAAKNRARQFRRAGIGDAYSGYRCFY